MLRFILPALFMLCLVPMGWGAEALDIAQYVQDTSVTIRANGSQGSGSLKYIKGSGTWVLTAGHVVTSNRHTREAVTRGTTKTVVEFDDVQIQIIRKSKNDERKVGEYLLDAEIIRYSDPDSGHDLALLHVRDEDFVPKASTKFYLDAEVPPIGTELYHCGSLLGSFGSNSVTGGIVSQHGRLLFGKVFDQTQCTIFPGSSGGAMVRKTDGLYIGMVVRGAGEGFNLIVPVRRMREWAKKNGVDFIFDDKAAPPDLEKLREGAIEDGWGSDKPTEAKAGAKNFPTLDIKTPLPRVMVVPAVVVPTIPGLFAKPKCKCYPCRCDNCAGAPDCGNSDCACKGCQSKCCAPPRE